MRLLSPSIAKAIRRSTRRVVALGMVGLMGPGHCLATCLMSAAPPEAAEEHRSGAMAMAMAGSMAMPDHGSSSGAPDHADHESSGHSHHESDPGDGCSDAGACCAAPAVGFDGPVTVSSEPCRLRARVVVFPTTVRPTAAAVVPHLIPLGLSPPAAFTT